MNQFGESHTSWSFNTLSVTTTNEGYENGVNVSKRPREPTLLEWLDSRVQEICDLARQGV